MAGMLQKGHLSDMVLYRKHIQGFSQSQIIKPGAQPELAISLSLGVDLRHVILNTGRHICKSLMPDLGRGG